MNALFKRRLVQKENGRLEAECGELRRERRVFQQQVHKMLRVPALTVSACVPAAGPASCVAACSP